MTYRIIEKKIYVEFDGKSSISMDKTYHGPIEERELEEKINKIKSRRINKGWTLTNNRLRMHDMEISFLVE